MAGFRLLRKVGYLIKCKKIFPLLIYDFASYVLVFVIKPIIQISDPQQMAENASSENV